jgi:putative ABC transport system permease protein
MRTAFRSFFSDPGFTTLVVVILAAGLGLALALVGLADAILFHPLPVSRPREMVRIFTTSPGQPLGYFSYPDFDDVRRSSRTLVGIIAQTQVLVAIGESPAQVRLGLAVTSDYFDVLEVPASMGRAFRPDDERQPVLVLHHDFWQSRYGADPRLVGRAIRLGGTFFTVIGIAPEGFGLDRFTHEDFYVPMGVYDAGLLASTGHPMRDRSRRFLTIVGRLAHGVRVEQARAELSTLASRLESEHPETNRDRRVDVLTEFEARTLTDRTMPALSRLLAAAALLILVITIANVTGLLLMRAEGRAREIAVRMAIGATSGRLLAEQLIEASLLSIAATAAAVPLAWAAMRMLAGAVTLPTDCRFAIAFRSARRFWEPFAAPLRCCGAPNSLYF